MRFLQPDLRRNAPIATVVHFFFTHHQNLSAQRSGISAIVPPAYRLFDAHDDPRPPAIYRHLAWQGAAP
jgi:hypothetical protein